MKRLWLFLKTGKDPESTELDGRLERCKKEIAELDRMERKPSARRD